MEIEYSVVPRLDPDVFLSVLHRSGLAERRPVAERGRVEQMAANANLVVLARDARSGEAVGLARALTDFAYCCYLSDLAVDRAFQRRGIGRRLIEETRRAAGPQSMLLLLSSPDAMSFYEAIGMDAPRNAFLLPRER
ncbi:GNAT family N-acetyltransferase [Methylocella sp.]|uniref:GNAT family N-acetyltransferase n=1 Tax=Methylocella sp. TaxID=1978226 RepID=UPI0035B257B0